MPSYKCNNCKTWFAETSKIPCPNCQSGSVGGFYADSLVYNLAVIEGRHKAGEITDADYNKFKNGIAYILTMRGIPQLYYGTELLFTNAEGGNHGLIRKEYPGGWEGDEAVG